MNDKVRGTVPPKLTFWRWLKRLCSGKPHFVIPYPNGDVYMRRWYLVPRNKWLNVYLHNIVRSDYAEELHDHPWNTVSILLTGDMEEIYSKIPQYKWSRKSRTVPRFWPIFRKAELAHRLLVHINRPVWTIFITGPKRRKWGFWVPSTPDETIFRFVEHAKFHG